MNREHESRADSDPDARSSAEQARLARIEERLKKARPRPPNLDAAALERAALSTEAEPVAQRNTQAATLRKLRWGRRRYRRMAAVAGSWACGALVGAMVTFFAMSRAEPGRDATNQTAVQTEGRPSMIRPEPVDAPKQQPQRGASPAQAPPPGRPQRLAGDDAFLALLADPFESGDSAYGLDGPTLHAGMYLRQRPDPSWIVRQPVPSATSANTPDGEPRRTEPPGSPKHDRTPQPEITRERLLQELLDERPGSLL